MHAAFPAAGAPTELALSARPLPIELRITKSEVGFVELLNWLARHNERLLLERPDLPGLYDSGVVYQREATEVWCDYLSMLDQGHEDCDGLASARAGELRARGHRAMSPEDGGFALSQHTRPDGIDAWVVLRTKGERGQPNLYHCLVLYRLWDPVVGAWTWWRDDPSARLGMYPEGARHPYNQGEARPLPDGLGWSGPRRPAAVPLARSPARARHLAPYNQGQARPLPDGLAVAGLLPDRPARTARLRAGPPRHRRRIR